MKYLKVIALISVVAVFLFSCTRDEIFHNPVNSTAGVFVLCEGQFGSSGDYSFINLINDSVSDNVYTNSNNGAFLGNAPDGIFTYLTSLYISVQGIFNQPGKMVRVNSTTNRLEDTSASFGLNPYNFAFGNNTFFVTNIAGSTVDILNLSLDHVSTVDVGPNPSDAIQAQLRIYVAKASYTTENSVAIVDIFNHSVAKAYFMSPPVSVANNYGGVYVSTYSHKKLYVLDSASSNFIDDSISINIPYPAIGDIISGNYRTLYIVGIADTSFSGYTGKALYKFDLVNRTLDSTFAIISSGSDDIYGVSYDYVSEKIYVANSRSGSNNGQVKVYDTNGALLRSYEIGNKFPRRFAFKFESH